MFQLHLPALPQLRVRVQPLRPELLLQEPLLLEEHLRPGLLKELADRRGQPERAVAAEA
jgi:hypothetical protein